MASSERTSATTDSIREHKRYIRRHVAFIRGLLTSINWITVRHTGHVSSIWSCVQRIRPSYPHQCMHGWMLHHSLEPIAAWKSLSKSMGQIDGKLGTTFVRIKPVTRVNNNWPATFTSL